MCQGIPQTVASRVKNDLAIKFQEFDFFYVEMKFVPSSSHFMRERCISKLMMLFHMASGISECVLLASY